MTQKVTQNHWKWHDLIGSQYKQKLSKQLKHSHTLIYSKL